MKHYTFNVILKDNSVRQYESTSLQTLYEYFAYTPRLDISLDDIKDIELVRKYKYKSFTDNRIYYAYVNERLYQKLVNEYNLEMHRKFNTLDDYIRYALAYNK